jgi:hypothetical protein
VRSYLVLVPMLLASLTAAGCGGSAPGNGVVAKSAGVSSDAGFLAAWTLPPAVLGVASLPSCEVGDSLTIVINRGPDAVRLLGVTANVAGTGSGRSTAQVTVATVRPGAQTAELAAGWDLIALKGYHLLPAAGLMLSPASVTGLSYDLVVRLRLSGVYARPWRITGLTLSVLIAGQRVTKVFPQHTQLPAVRCGR